MSYRTREARVGSDDRYGAPPIPPTGSKGGRSGAGGYYDSDNYVTRAERERERSDHRERRTSLTDVEAPVRKGRAARHARRNATHKTTRTVTTRVVATCHSLAITAHRNATQHKHHDVPTPSPMGPPAACRLPPAACRLLGLRLRATEPVREELPELRIVPFLSGSFFSVAHHLLLPSYRGHRRRRRRRRLFLLPWPPPPLDLTPIFPPVPRRSCPSCSSTPTWRA